MKLLEIEDLKSPVKVTPVDDQQDDQLQGDNVSQGDDLDSEIEQDVQDTNNMVKRYVKGAHLVFKRASEDGSYDELWIYPTVDVKTDVAVRKAILGGTDIVPGSTSSEDGSQHCETWTAGNAQMLFITGLPN